MAKTQRIGIDYPSATGSRTGSDGHARGDQFGFGNFEVQKLLCTHSGTDTAYSFTLTFFGKKTASIYGTWAIWQLRDAIEALGSVSRVKTSWNSGNSAKTICAASHTGGILIEFQTELGDLPLMVSDSGDALVSEYVKGSKTNLECSGVEAGVCNRLTGKCECFPGYTSSSTYLAGFGYGARGDCGFVNGVHYSGEIDAFNGDYDFSRRLQSVDGGSEDDGSIVDRELEIMDGDSSRRYRQDSSSSSGSGGGSYESDGDGDGSDQSTSMRYQSSLEVMEALGSDYELSNYNDGVDDEHRTVDGVDEGEVFAEEKFRR